MMMMVMLWRSSIKSGRRSYPSRSERMIAHDAPFILLPRPQQRKTATERIGLAMQGPCAGDPRVICSGSHHFGDPEMEFAHGIAIGIALQVIRRHFLQATGHPFRSDETDRIRIAFHIRMDVAGIPSLLLRRHHRSDRILIVRSETGGIAGGDQQDQRREDSYPVEGHYRSKVDPASCRCSSIAITNQKAPVRGLIEEKSSAGET